jgi:GntR family L-lactate dehydrogenase operon transcriptional regulator
VADQTVIERIALETLAEAQGPIGASRLVEQLSQHGIALSEATAGRFLRALDRRGLTRPIGKLGRLLTEEGRGRLKQLELLRRQGEQSAVLVGAATPVDVDELIDLLYVRRAVEPEAARHAALRAGDEEREAIRALADSHMHHVMSGTDHAAAALSFHRLVARASHNKMLTAVASLTLDPSNHALSTLLDFISIEADANVTFAHEHRDIIDAIVAREPQRAETAMREHVDDLIRIVQEYRQRVPLLEKSMRFIGTTTNGTSAPEAVAGALTASDPLRRL